jgi:excisionase family DNA binding protein
MSVISTTSRPLNQATESPWLTVEEAADRARCGVKTIYREVRAGRLKAARIGGRRELRLQSGWIDDWLHQSATPVA